MKCPSPPDFFGGHTGSKVKCYAVESVVKLLSARLEGSKLEPEGQRAEVGFPTADQGFSCIQGTLFGFYGI